MSRSTAIRQNILELSDGVFSTLTDMVLALVYCFGEYATLPRKHWSSVPYQVEQSLQKFNSTTIKKAFRYLLKRGHISNLDSQSLPSITSAGLEKLHQQMPKYKPSRPWDGKFYLINYDLPRTRNSDRDFLRTMIKLLGCARLQHSAWVTPFHPKNFLPQTLDPLNLHHVIAVSCLDTTVGLGSKNIHQHIQQLYPLDKLNQKYADFISTQATQPFDITLEYWSILKQDPQLPFELLPKDWLGDKAYNFFREKTSLT